MDGLCTLARIEEERRTLETMERKRNAKEEAQRSRKKRKTRGSKDSKQDKVRAVRQEKHAEVTAMLANGNTRQKSLGRHTSTASAAEGGVSLM